MQGQLLEDVVLHLRERDDTLDSENPFKWVRTTTSELFSGKRVVVFGLPGAFTPTCTNEQLPGFERLYDNFIAKGVDEIYCTAMNDAFVMYQWAKSLGIEKVKMLPDGNGDLADAVRLRVRKNNLGFGDRSWRYAMVVDNMEIEHFLEEEGYMDNCPTDPYCESTPENVLRVLS